MAAVNLNAELLAELDGTIFLHNECGEAEQDTTTPGANDQQFYCQNPTLGTGAPNERIAFEAAATKTFLADNFIWMKHICAMPAGQYKDANLFELTYLKYLAYRNRLSVGELNLATYHVRYNDVQISNPATANSYTHRVCGVEHYDALASAVATWYNEHRDVVWNLTKYFSNLVCTVAYVFRQLGHHYINGATYEDTYHRIWNKVTGTPIDTMITCPWEMISTIGLHSILPMVLDGYWTFCVLNGRCAAPLVLRHGVPYAGTAAPFALLVGWSDARSIYGRLLTDSQGIYDDLEALIDTLRTHRWAHGINATYYGAETRRIDMTKYQAMAATIDGVYEACAPDATLLQSKSLQREATGAPLQRDIARLAAKHIRAMCAKKLATDPVV